jgi:hypothetical protein
VDWEPETRRSSQPATASFGSIGVSLALYAVAAGILAVSAGLLVRGAEQWGPLTGAVSLLVTVTITVVAGLAAEPVVRWLVPVDLRRSARRPEPRGAGADRRGDDLERVRRSR